MTQAPFDSLNTKRLGFWKRQFAPIPTPAQDTFDVIFAVVLPILVLVMDPVIFKSSVGALGRPFLGNYQLLAYLVSTIEIAIFLTWRTFRLQMRPYAPVFAGAFVAAGIFSAAIGLAILPLTLIGLIFLIGVLGLTPFFTAFVFFRNGVRAARVQVTPATLKRRFAVVVLSAVMVLGVPLWTTSIVESAISSTVEMMVMGDATDARVATTRLKRFRFIPSKYTDRIALAYETETNPSKREALNAAYHDLTGGDLDMRRRILLAD